MPTLSQELLHRIRFAGQSLAGERLPVSLARLYSQYTHVRAGQRGLASWSEEETTKLIADALTLSDAALLLESVDDEHWVRDLRRAAEILEWAGALYEDQTHIPVALLAAAAYQLSGYPARARGLLRVQTNRPAQSRVIISFLQGDFIHAQQEIGRYWSTILLSTDPNSETLAASTAHLIETEVIRALGVLLSHLRWGDDVRIDAALTHLDTATKTMLSGPTPVSWLLAKMSYQYACKCIFSDVRRNLGLLVNRFDAEGRIAAEAYIRLSFASGSSLVWPSQEAGIQELLSRGSFALCTPTGSGKTRVAEVAILKGLFEVRSSPDAEGLPIVLYIVPTRALAAEVEGKLRAVLRRVSGQVVVTSLYGGADWGASDCRLSLDGRAVIIATHEKADALLRFIGPPLLKRLRLVVVDEAHSVDYGGTGDDLQEATSRALRLETLVGRLKAALAGNNASFVALSAVAGGIGPDLARWMSGTADTDAIRTAYRSTRQLVGRLLYQPSHRSAEIRYDLLDGQRVTVVGRDAESPYIREPFPPHPPAPNHETGGPEVRLRPLLLWAAMHLAAFDVDGNAHPVLVYVTQQLNAYAKTFLELLDGAWSNVELPIFHRKAQSPQETALFVRCLKSCADYFGETSMEYRLLVRGIVLHHGKMPGHMGRLLIGLVEAKIVNIIVATSTLAQGVNLPFETVLIPSLRFYGGYLPSSDFANISGRAGRPGVTSEGRCLVLMTTGETIGTAAHYEALLEQLVVASMQSPQPVKNRGPLAILVKRIYEKWKEIARDSADAAFYRWLEETIYELSPSSQPDDAVTSLDTLDGFLIAAISEMENLHDTELSDEAIEEFLQAIWRGTFSYYSSVQTQTIGDILVRRGSSIRTRVYPSRESRRRIYLGGLVPRETKVLLNILPRLEGLLRLSERYHAWTERDRIAFVLSLINEVASVPSFKIDQPPNNQSVENMLHWWLSPRTSPIRPNPTQISAWYAYGDKNFQYRFNWGLGCAFGLLLGIVGGQTMNADAWQQRGLPWAAFWLKDMMTWGLLDPVATHLLITRMADTRPQAGEMALDYWREAGGTTSDELYEPRLITRWASAAYPVPAPEIAALPMVEGHTVGLAAGVAEHASRLWRVLPVPVGRVLYWIDPAGYRLAQGVVPENWNWEWASNYDFVLHTDTRTVQCTPYL